jgi:hypothetical protein
MNNEKLVLLAKELQPKQPKLAPCWNLVIRGLEIGWLDSDNLDELLHYLLHGNDYSVEELGFEIIGDDLRISFLDEYLYCSPSDMIKQFKSLKEALES